MRNVVLMGSFYYETANANHLGLAFPEFLLPSGKMNLNTNINKNI